MPSHDPTPPNMDRLLKNGAAIAQLVMAQGGSDSDKFTSLTNALATMLVGIRDPASRVRLAGMVRDGALLMVPLLDEELRQRGVL